MSKKSNYEYWLERVEKSPNVDYDKMEKKISNLDAANDYFRNETKKVYVERCNSRGIETFEQFLRHHYRDNYYYYSFFAIMGLESQDYLVRGNIALDGTRRDYPHGWVEFKYQNTWYVFDSSLYRIVLKKDYYEKYSPQITYKITQEKILQKYLNEKYAVEFTKGFWQFKYFVKEGEDVSESKMLNYDRNNGYIPSGLMLARIQISKFSPKVFRFIGYDETSD